ncbi:hypothetical protein K0M31_010540, partial [Melipona bicolor]
MPFQRMDVKDRLKEKEKKKNGAKNGTEDVNGNVTQRKTGVYARREWLERPQRAACTIPRGCISAALELTWHGAPQKDCRVAKAGERGDRATRSEEVYLRILKCGKGEAGPHDARKVVPAIPFPMGNVFYIAVGIV